MPWTLKQHRLFEWAAHNPGAAQAAGYHIGQGKAAQMASEGIKQSTTDTVRKKTLVKSLRGY